MIWHCHVILTFLMSQHGQLYTIRLFVLLPSGEKGLSVGINDSMRAFAEDVSRSE
jgi:hypothetical protein